MRIIPHIAQKSIRNNDEIIRKAAHVKGKAAQCRHRAKCLKTHGQRLNRTLSRCNAVNQIQHSCGRGGVPQQADIDELLKRTKACLFELAPKTSIGAPLFCSLHWQIEHQQHNAVSSFLWPKLGKGKLLRPLSRNGYAAIRQGDGFSLVNNGGSPAYGFLRVAHFSATDLARLSFPGRFLSNSPSMDKSL